jgi:hypothetical protein
VTVGAILSVPNRFPYQNVDPARLLAIRGKSKLSSAKSLDIVGAFFLLGASLLLATVLLEAGVSFEWRSAAAISLFVISGLLWIGFVLQEWWLSKSSSLTQAIFPWEFFKNKAWMGTLL